MDAGQVIEAVLIFAAFSGQAILADRRLDKVNQQIAEERRTAANRAAASTPDEFVTLQKATLTTTEAAERLKLVAQAKAERGEDGTKPTYPLPIY